MLNMCIIYILTKHVCFSLHNCYRYLLKEFLASCKDVLAVNGSVEITLCAGQGGTPSDSKHREQQNHWQARILVTLNLYIY